MDPDPKKGGEQKSSAYPNYEKEEGECRDEL
jgi:hypothetical protein